MATLLYFCTHQYWQPCPKTINIDNIDKQCIHQFKVCKPTQAQYPIQLIPDFQSESNFI